MITININKAKIVAHNLRRSARAMEFAPYDDVIAKQIPGQAENAELARQAIRDKYAHIQIQIDQANEISAIKQALQLS